MAVITSAIFYDNQMNLRTLPAEYKCFCLTWHLTVNERDNIVTEDIFLQMYLLIVTKDIFLQMYLLSTFF